MNQFNEPCSLCKSKNTELLYSSPLMPLGGQLIAKEQEFSPELFYPLDYMICRECHTFQSVESIPEVLLKKENAYVASVSQTIIDRDKRIAKEAIDKTDNGKSRFIVEIGGADGVCLENYLNSGHKLLNIEPVAMTGELAKAKNINTWIEFFSTDSARRAVAAYGKADLIIAKQVLENVTDMHEFLQGLKFLLAENGRIVLEVPNVRNLLEGNFYEVVVHLRKYHFSFLSLEKLFGMHEFEIEEGLNYPELGGGFRLYIGHKGNVKRQRSAQDLKDQEIRAGLNTSEYYKNVFKRGNRLKRTLVDFIDDQKNAGKKIVGLGAGIKGSALLNFCGLDRRYIDFIADNGKHKHGKFMPGTRIPIVPFDQITEDVDYVILLAWIYKEEMLKLLDGYMKRGGKVIMPVPDMQIIERKEEKVAL